MNPQDIKDPMMNVEHENINLTNIILIGNDPKLDELIRIYPHELFSDHIPMNNDDLIQGRSFYQDLNYSEAMKSYRKLIESFSKLKEPIPKDVMQIAAIALSNNASCKLIMNDHRGVIDDLEKSIAMNVILIKTALRYQKLIVTQIIQLFKSYINLFELESAHQLWSRVRNDFFLLNLIHRNQKSIVDFQNLTKILHWLIFIEKKIYECKSQMRWDLVNHYFKILENKITIWNLNDSIEEILPLELERIKAESLAWLGYPEEAEWVATQCKDPVDFDTPQDLWLRGLISFSYGNLEESLEHFERLDEIKKDSNSTGTKNRVKYLLSQQDEVKKLSIDQHLESLPKMTALIRYLLLRVGQHPIEQTFEDHIRVIYIETCFKKLNKMTNVQELEKYIHEVIKYTTEILSSKALVDNMNARAPMIPIRLKKFLLIAFLYKSRIWAYRDYNLFQSIDTYSRLIHYFRFLNGYNLVVNLNLNLINEELNQVKRRCAFLNQYHHQQQQIRFNMTVNQSLIRQAEISKEKALEAALKEKGYQEALRLARSQLGYYKVLGVKRTACQRDIRSAFKKLALETHPDRGGLTRHFQLLNEIHSTLIDRMKRYVYDNRQNKLKD
ncbi:uncharacterized protein MELLADRAFT_112039 [Melampsora larici-populina 98AG31]|uniref:J domain-containing protein n=1 Tax=Melampsora larici-populina (strain 98AG31 / pathotype 3-4-7) TaxID=747676 RepID=F4S572_MELLP|nr:uncharacterized protein MELLADRAFT_112039 [Melampsora larici-populina 98AG31]EGG00212.1 hypothetical protein MELLADRAFT_112039 [Melampsora larici-populina 98AG31]